MQVVENIYPIGNKRDQTNIESNLNRFKQLRESIKSDSLSLFLKNVFDDDLYHKFIHAPASVKHHHSCVGGLLQHSLEVAEHVANQAYESSDEHDIAVVAALLHDIGKVRTYNKNGHLSTLGRLVNHDSLTLEICAGALKQLDETWPDAAITLRHIWTCSTPGARYGHTIASTLAHTVQYADRVSVSNYMQRKALQEKNLTNGCVWNDNTYYWQPKPEKRKHVWKF